MAKSSLRISIKNFSVEADDGFRYSLTKRFFYFYVYLAYQRKEHLGKQGGLVETDQICHLPHWEKNSFLSVGKQIRRHIVEMQKIGRNLIESRQKIKGPFRLNVDPTRITFDVSDEVIRQFLGLGNLVVFYDENEEENLYEFVTQMCEGHISFNEGRLREASEHFQHAHTRAFTNEQKITALQQIGRVLERLGKYNQASKAFKAAMRLLKGDPQNLYDLASLYSHDGWIYLRKRKLELAEKTYFKALDLVRDKRYYDLLGDIYNGLAKVYESRDRYKEAIGLYKNALGYWGFTEYFYGISAVYFNIGNIYRKWGDSIPGAGGAIQGDVSHLAKEKYIRAISWAKRCIELCDRTGVGDETSQDRILVSICYQHLGQIEKALQYALEAEEMALKAENARDLAKSTDILGQLYLLKGEKNTAETYFQRSSEYSSKIR